MFVVAFIVAACHSDGFPNGSEQTMTGDELMPVEVHDDTSRVIDIDTTGRSAFVDVSAVAQGVIVEMRYCDTFNFVGTRIDGYVDPVALLTARAADSIKAVCDDLASQGLTLKIYDAYRPQRAVDHFVRWSKNYADTAMKGCFYPNEDKHMLFANDYISSHSAHSRGSTVDVTIVDNRGQELDMGGHFDLMDASSHPSCGGNPATGQYRPNDTISKKQFENRMLLRAVMSRHGFRPLYTEWWHFTLRNEPYRERRFDFHVARL